MIEQSEYNFIPQLLGMVELYVCGEGVGMYDPHDGKIVGFRPIDNRLCNFGLQLAQDLAQAFCNAVRYGVVLTDNGRYQIKTLSTEQNALSYIVYFPRYNDVLLDTCHYAAWLFGLIAYDYGHDNITGSHSVLFQSPELLPPVPLLDYKQPEKNTIAVYDEV